MLNFVTGNNISFINHSFDVLSKGCYPDNFDRIACTRIGILTTIIFVTTCVCVYRIVKLHRLGHPQVHQYLVFYLATIELIALMAKLITKENYPQIEFAAIYLKLAQFIILCHSHWTLASRIFRRERILSWCIIPVLVLFFLFASVVCVSGSLGPKSSWLECMEPHWLTLSLSEFIAIQLFVIAGLFITRKINSVSALESFKSQQKRHLWGVIAAYEIAGFAAVVYDVSLKSKSTELNGCSGVYNHKQAVYSSVLAVYIFSRFLLPIWVMLIMYQPIRGHLIDDEERLLSWTFEPPPLHLPVDKCNLTCQNEYSSSPCLTSTPVPSYTSITRGSSIMSPGYMTGILRRTILTPIKEEDLCAQLSTQDCSNSISDCKYYGLGAYDNPSKLCNV